ncbi:MAG: YtxH domain-containing protein [Anaerolineae bacterium]|nr:YtxH domain-containing protein [Anaerolineae bacterium]
MRRTGMFLLGLLLGGLVGLVLALVLAPNSGEKMRKEAQEHYEQLLAEARQAAEDRRKALEMELENLSGGTAASA